MLITTCVIQVSLFLEWFFSSLLMKFSCIFYFIPDIVNFIGVRYISISVDIVDFVLGNS